MSRKPKPRTKSLRYSLNISQPLKRGAKAKVTSIVCGKCKRRFATPAKFDAHIRKGCKAK